MNFTSTNSKHKLVNRRKGCLAHKNRGKYSSPKKRGKVIVRQFKIATSKAMLRRVRIVIHLLD
jgi:hypothetical protein